MFSNSYLKSGLVVLSSCLLVSCATPPETATSENKRQSPFFSPPPEQPSVQDREALVLSQQQAKEPEYFMREGSGVFLNKQAAARQSAKQPAKGDVTLNFEGVDLREVVKVVFEEILRENYVIDPKVQGTVTIHTTYPVTSEAVLPILDTILQMNGAALVRNGSLYKVLPEADVKNIALKPSTGATTGKLKAGQGVQIVPLQFISAKEMKKILESFSSSGEQIRVDEGRNLLILAGSYQKIRNLLQTVEIFDVDWLRGMSFGLIPLKHTDAQTITEELGHILGKESSPLADLIKLIPVQRLNAVMVISQQPRYISEARRLITQFDQGSDKSPERRLFVYHLKHGKAENIATILQSIFGSEATAKVSGGGGLGSDPLSRSNVRSPTSSGIDLKSSNADKDSKLAKASPAVATDASIASKTTASGSDSAEQPATIIADQDNNAILIMANPTDYQKIKSTIERLDISPKQVLIEATIAEVVLSDNLSYGVRWFFEGKTGGGRVFEGGLGAPLPDVVGGDGFSLGIFGNNDQMKLFFDILDTETAVKFLSAPQIMVIDNQTATFRVGDQIPIVTRSSQSTIDPDSPIVSEVQYRDTGTLLQVTPRINEGGMVTLEISQEVSNPGAEAAVGGGGNVAISQRTIESTVVVHDGQSVVLGGLIREREEDSQGGIPGLRNIPVVGNLFGNTKKSTNRTELIVTLTPKVVRNPREAYEVSQELRERIKEATLYQQDFNQRQEVK